MQGKDVRGCQEYWENSVSEMFFKAVVQVVLIFGSEAWVKTLHMAGIWGGLNTGHPDRSLEGILGGLCTGVRSNHFWRR